MKRRLIFYSLVLLLGLVSCESENGEGKIWDVAPVNFSIFVTDSRGNDLLDSASQANIIKDIAVSYQGKTYPVMTERELNAKRNDNTMTRAYLATFYGLVLCLENNNYSPFKDKYKIVFGEFDGEENVDHREISLMLPNGRKASLAYSNSFRWQTDGSPDVSRQFFFGNQLLKDNAGQNGHFHFRYSEESGLEYVPIDE